ncbi:MAG TPA: Rieske (2Fe-2S) protein [Candidatus Binatia bacterium]|jgi:nitrite reductase/ring-hydroxylating ferredoxin subunit
MNLKDNKKPPKRKFVGEVSELKPGTTKKFRLINGKSEVEGLLLNYQGSLYAYLNRCPHLGISLDWVDNQFFTIDGRYLMCANHGATFEPATGECIWGPCPGATLRSLPLQVEAGRIFVHSYNQGDVD